MTQLDSQLCPCQEPNGAIYSSCCQPFHQGINTPDTAEKLMRSRYSAYVLVLIDYLVDSTLPTQRAFIDARSMREWAEKADWLGLTIASSPDGQKSDQYGKVAFVAHYKNNDKIKHHKENANFRKENERWYFVYNKGDLDLSKGNIGRNDLCPCGSDKKYKKCCGA